MSLRNYLFYKNNNNGVASTLKNTPQFGGNNRVLSTLQVPGYCGVVGCNSCGPGQQHYCKSCGMFPSNHLRRYCQNVPRGNNVVKSTPNRILQVPGNCGVVGCTSCGPGQQHYCRSCGMSPSNHLSRNCQNVPKRNPVATGKSCASFVCVVHKNFKGTGRDALLLIVESTKGGILNWIGGKIDRGETESRAALREATEEYGVELVRRIRGQVVGKAGPDINFKGSNFYVVCVNGFSRKGTYNPTQFPSETSGASWIFLDDIVRATSANRTKVSGLDCVGIRDTDGRTYWLYTFVTGVVKQLRGLGKI